MSLKKGLDEIAALERLFTENYGEESVKNFRSGWDEKKERKYLAQLKEESTARKNKESIKVNVGGVFIPKAALDKKSQRSCPVCKTYSFSPKDDLYMNRFKCCYGCYIKFVQGREERWQEGWRPSHGKYKPPRIKSFIRAVRIYISNTLWRLRKWLNF